MIQEEAVSGPELSVQTDVAQGRLPSAPRVARLREASGRWGGQPTPDMRAVPWGPAGVCCAVFICFLCPPAPRPLGAGDRNTRFAPGAPTPSSSSQPPDPVAKLFSLRQSLRVSDPWPAVSLCTSDPNGAHCPGTTGPSRPKRPIS